MTISIVALGTRGDVQPLLALGLGLRNAGFEVRVVTHPNFRAQTESLGLAYFGLSLDIEEVFQSSDGVQWLMSGRNPFKTAFRMARIWHKYFSGLLPELCQACQGSDAILFSYLGMCACHVGEKYNIPCIGTWPTPVTAEPNAAMAVAIPGPWAGLLNGQVGLAAHWGAEFLIGQTFGRAQNSWRRELALPPIGLRGIMDHFRKRGIPIFYGFSPLVVQQPRTWSSRVEILGYWLLENKVPWEPSAALAKFVEQDPVPFYIGFGSMAAADPMKIVSVVVEAIEQTNSRAVFATGWTGLKAEQLNNQLPESIFAVDYVSHDWLFPRIKGMVHHGGTSTTGAVLCAGKPSVVVPFFADQSFWADKLEEHGLAAKTIPFNKFCSEKLIAALEEMQNDEELQKRAAAFAQMLKLEDGVKNAVHRISELLQGMQHPDQPPASAEMQTPDQLNQGSAISSDRLPHN